MSDSTGGERKGVMRKSLAQTRQEKRSPGAGGQWLLQELPGKPRLQAESGSSWLTWPSLA